MPRLLLFSPFFRKLGSIYIGLILFHCPVLLDAAAQNEKRPILTRSRRPGILVLINDADWELEGEADYVLEPRDNILFVSTLHGG